MLSLAALQLMLAEVADPACAVTFCGIVGASVSVIGLFGAPDWIPSVGVYVQVPTLNR
ncbi:hypothetical protein D3C76_1463570 [compost metagenome]